MRQMDLHNLPIAGRLRALVERHDQSARKLSLSANLSETAVRDIISGKSIVPRLKTLLAISDALGCSVTDLITVDEIKGALADPEIWLSNRQMKDLVSLQSDLMIYTNPSLSDAEKREIVDLLEQGDQEKSAVTLVVPLKGPKFARANLEGAQLCNANLEHADFTEAFLKNTDFTGANLTRAIFRGAFMDGAILRGANITSADFSGVDLSKVIFK